MVNKKSRQQTYFSRVKTYVINSFKEDWPTMTNHLSSCVISLAAASYTSGVFEAAGQSNKSVVASASAVSFVTYWGPFIGQLAYRDRNQMKDAQGYSKKKVWKKTKEYVGMITFVELAYLAYRTTTQYVLQYYGMEPEEASFKTDLVGMSLFTFIMPLVRSAWKKNKSSK